MDPEELRSVVQRIRELTARIIARFGGYFAPSTSEAIQIYFGYPQALEDSARRAVLAGLEIRTEIKKLQERLKKSQELMTDFCIGIHTGIVVTEEVDCGVSSERHSIVGNVPRVAAGLAALAEPSSVVVSGTTRQIIGHAFIYHSLGTHSGKSIGRNVEVLEVIGQNDVETNVSADATRPPSPLIGREHEMGLLDQRWEQVTGSAGQVVLICADAGVGKSRLLSAFRGRLGDAALQSLEARCSAYHQNSALYPISELLKRVTHLSSGDSDEAKLDKLETLLQRYGIPVEPVVPLIVDLISIPLGPRYAVFEGTPERRKQKTIEAIVELLILESDIVEESGDDYQLTRPLASVTIPSTLQDSLMARLDKLGSAKEVAQLAAVIGREFAFELLAALAPLDEETLRAELASLVNAELVYQRGFFPRTRFTFKHALVQDAAYASLLRATRQQWHGRIADVLATQFSQIAENDPELLAHHFTAAGRAVQAIGYWLKAGLQAQERSANAEAISHFRQGLTLVETLEPSEERDGMEFQFQIPLGVALLTAQGYAAPEVGPVFERASELGQKLAGPVEQFFIHWGIWAWRVVREELPLCNQMAAEAQRIVEPLGDAGLRMEALFTPALTSFYLGDFETSRKCCEQGFELYDEATAKLYARHTGQNVGVTMQCYWALSLWHLGYPDQARRRIQQAVDMARSLNHPFSLAYALGHSSWLYHSFRLSAEVKRAADEDVALAKEQGFAFWLAEGLLHQAFGLLLERQAEPSLQALQAGLDVFNMTGAKLSLCHFYAMFAEAHRLAGDIDKALRRIDEALRASATHGSAFYLAEIHRLRGEMMLASDRIEDAEACFHESLEIACSQQAKSWELRTTISLCRLWQTQNRHQQARQALAHIYAWFHEGFQTPDLLDAKHLLDTLG